MSRRSYLSSHYITAHNVYDNRSASLFLAITAIGQLVNRVGGYLLEALRTFNVNLNRYWTVLALVSVSLVVAGCGALNLAGEPEVVATLPPRPTAPPIEEVTLPEEHPNLLIGASVYAANCTDCHGSNGMGDGQLVQQGQVMSPGDMTNWNAVAVDTPTVWFNIITNGNLENLMPPWAGSLNETERWAVAMYNYTLSYTEENIERGATIYTETCTACHGETGTGDGPQAEEMGLEPQDLSDAAHMVTLSDESIYGMIANGGEVGETHAFGNDLEADDLLAVTQYTRTLSLGGTEMIGGVGEVPADAEIPDTGSDSVENPHDGDAASAGVGNEDAPADVEDAFEVVENATISGTVSNDTPDGTLPDGATVELHIFDGGLVETETMETTLAGDSFTFEDVTVDPNFTYVALVSHNDRQFISQPTPGRAVLDDTLDLPIVIYEVTDDESVISIESIAVQVSPQEDRLQVAQFVIYNNNSERIYSEETVNEEGETIFTSAVVELPPGAVVGGFSANPDRFIVNEENFTVTDTQPILPGDGHMVQLVYFIPFDHDAIIEHPLNYDAEGIFRLLLDNESLEVSGDTLESYGPVEIGESTYFEYGQDIALEAGDAIRYELTRFTGASNAIGGDIGTLPIVLFALSGVSAAVAAGLFIYGRIQDSRESGNREIDNLVAQIAQLDNLHEAGEINHDVYQRQRAELKEKLRVLMQKEGQSAKA